MIENEIRKTVAEAVKELYGQEFPQEKVGIERTNPAFRAGGDLTVLIFPLVKLSRKTPEQTAAEVGAFIKEKVRQVNSFSIVKGFLNLLLEDSYWLNFLAGSWKQEQFGFVGKSFGKPVVIEFSSPNTNKPLHLGHIRNNLLGHSISEILKACGQNVIKVNLVNDRGIHICKSMLAWKKWGNGDTPASTAMKGDKFVGMYYVVFEREYREEIAKLMTGGMTEEDATAQSTLMKEARLMLLDWEKGDAEVMALWKTMNGWVYEGFERTYRRLGIGFHKTDYESQTYLLGKSLAEEGVNMGALFRKDDGSVWIDLTAEGFDQKLLLRSDGTSVYMTQDLGTAKQRYDEYRPEKMLYVVGSEQNYHFAVLKKVLEKLGFAWAADINHLSYGMVELPEGKMKSREGTVVDADDLMDEMYRSAQQTTEELGKLHDFSTQEAESLFEMLGMGALKYFILKVDPEKNMLFNPKESIDFDGNTGPFIQYTHARICSLLRKSENNTEELLFRTDFSLSDEEREVLIQLHSFPQVLAQAADEFSPAQIANYTYELVKAYNHFYQKVQVLKEPDADKRNFRLALSLMCGRLIRNAMQLLGIFVPEKM